MNDVQPAPQNIDAAGGLQFAAVPCPLCAATDNTPLFKLPDLLCGIPGEFTIVACSSCGHRFLNPQPVPDSLPLCYPLHYGPHQPGLSDPPVSTAAPGAVAVNTAAPGAVTVNTAACGTADEQPGTPDEHESPSGSGSNSSSARRASQSDRPWFLRMLPLRHVPGLKRCYEWLLEDHSQPLPEISQPFPTTDDDNHGGWRPRALEIGCATGSYLLRLRAHGWDVLGVEPSATAASAARQAGLQIVTGTLDNWDSPSGSFDAACAWMVLEHVPDPRATVRQLQQVLRPGGQLLLSIPNAGCWESRFFGRHWYAWEPPRHLQHFSVAAIWHLLEQSGFEDVRVVHQKNLSYVIGSVGLWILSRWPNSQLGSRLRDYPGHPGHWSRLVLAPCAHLLSLLRQGGRLTITARRGDIG